MQIGFPLVCMIALGLGCAHAPSPSIEGAVEEAPSVERPSEHPKDLAPGGKAGGKAEAATGIIPRVELNRVLDAAPGHFLQHVQTEPSFVGGRFHGWRLASFFPGDVRFAGIDLRAGDVVLTVNGRAIEQPEQLMEVWEALRFERSLVVTFEREGRARELRFDIRD